MVEEEKVYQLSCIVASIPTSGYIVGLDLTIIYKLDPQRCVNWEQNTILQKWAHCHKLKDKEIGKNSEVEVKSFLSL